MFNNILGILIGGFLLWVVSRGDRLDGLFRMKLGDFTLDDVFLILLSIGAIALFLKSFFGLFQP